MASTVLGIRGDRFTINGTPTFLYGISYYAGLGAPPDKQRRDLDEMKRRGFHWLRVWVTWSAFGQDVSAIEGRTGAAREPYMARLRTLLAECDRRGLIVDVTISRGKDTLQALDAHRKAVETLTATLKPYRNWYLDLSNERNIRDARFTSFADLKILCALTHEIDPERPVTASHSPDISREELEEYLKTVAVDFLTPHRPRDATSAGQTEAKSRECLVWMREVGRVVPLHYQEPFRRGYARWEPTAEDFVTDLRGAISGGAAGWCLHNGDERDAPDGRPRRSFDLRETHLFEGLDTEEKKALGLLTACLPGASGKTPGPV